MRHLKGFLLAAVCLAAIATFNTEVQAAEKPPCEMPARFKQIGVTCMNSGAKGKKEIMMCAFKNMGVVDDGNTFSLVKAFVLGSEVVMNQEGAKEKGVEGTLKCYEQFGQPGQGTEAVECVMSVFKEICNI